MQAHMLEDSHLAMQNLADSHWILVQQSKPVIRLTMEWLKCPKDDYSTPVQVSPGASTGPDPAPVCCSTERLHSQARALQGFIRTVCMHRIQ